MCSEKISRKWLSPERTSGGPRWALSCVQSHCLTLSGAIAVSRCKCSVGVIREQHSPDRAQPTSRRDPFINSVRRQASAQGHVCFVGLSARRTGPFSTRPPTTRWDYRLRDLRLFYDAFGIKVVTVKLLKLPKLHKHIFSHLHTVTYTVIILTIYGERWELWNRRSPLNNSVGELKGCILIF